MSKIKLGKTPGRMSLEAFLEANASKKLTLEIGSEDSSHSRWFPNRIAMNVEFFPLNQVQGDAHCLPFRDQTFDVILCTEVFEHLHTPSLTSKEMLRVLKPGGKLILTTPFAYPIHNAPIDYYRYTEFGLAHLLNAWHIEYLRESTSDTATLMVFIYYWLFNHKGLLWKIPKVLWAGIWLIYRWSFKRSLTLQLSKTNTRNLLPTGYLLVARRPKLAAN